MSFHGLISLEFWPEFTYFSPMSPRCAQPLHFTACKPTHLPQLLPMSSIWDVFLNYPTLPVIFLSTFLSFLRKQGVFSTCLCLQGPTNYRCSINVLMRTMIINMKSCLHQCASRPRHRETRITRNP